jgi:hypothetical protein
LTAGISAEKLTKIFICGLFLLGGLTFLRAQTAPGDSNAARSTPGAAQAPADMTKKVTDLVNAGQYTQAQQLTTGLLVAYPDDQRLIKTKSLLEKLIASASSTVATPETDHSTSASHVPAAQLAAEQLTGMDKVEYNSLIELGREAQQTTDSEEQKKLLQQFMDKSSPFLQKYPHEMLLWQLRAAGAITLDDALAGYEAGQKLLAAGGGDNDSANLGRLLAQLNLKGWMDKQFLEKRRAEMIAETQRRRSETETILIETAAQADYRNHGPKIGGFTSEGFVVTDDKGNTHPYLYDEVKTFQVMQKTKDSYCYVVLRGDPPAKFPFPWHWWRGDTDWPFWHTSRCSVAQKFADALKTLAKEGAPPQ